MTLHISALSAESPDMSDPEFTELLEDIRRQGQLVPVVVSNGEIIDGRKRFRACQILGIELKTIELTSDPEAAAYALNILRTHYNTSQRAMFAARRATLVRGDVTAQKNAVGESADRPQSEKSAAKAVGVHTKRVTEAKRIRRLGDPAVAAAVE